MERENGLACRVKEVNNRASQAQCVSQSEFVSSQLSAIRRKRNNALEQVTNLLNAYGGCNAWSDVKAFVLKEWCLIVVVYHHFHTCYCRQEWDVILLLCSQDKGKSCKPQKREACNNLFGVEIGTSPHLEFSALMKLLLAHRRRTGFP